MELTITNLINSTYQVHSVDSIYEVYFQGTFSDCKAYMDSLKENV